MATQAVTFLDNLKAAILADGTLSAYVEAVKIVTARALANEERLAEELPSFDDYAVLIAPRSQTTNNIACRQKQDILEVAVVGMAYSFNHADAIDGEGLGVGRTGILKIRQDLFDLLDGNTFSSSRVLIEDRELLSPAPFELVLGDHYLRTVITFKAWLPEYVS